jgi:hypothetical protein
MFDSTKAYVCFVRLFLNLSDAMRALASQYNVIVHAPAHHQQQQQVS